MILELLPEQRRRTRQHPDDLEPSVQVINGLLIREPLQRLARGLVQIVNSLVPKFASKRVMREEFDMLVKTLRVKLLDDAHKLHVNRASSLLEYACICDSMRERMLEGILLMRQQAGLIEEFSRLQIGEPIEIGYRLKKIDGKFMADHGRHLQKGLLLRGQAIDPRSENCMHG